MLYPDVASYSDYTVNIGFTENGEYKSADVPLSSFSVAETMTQDALPGIQAKEQVGNINLSRAVSFVLVFEGYNNPFINYITDKQLASGKTDNNEPFTLKVTRAEKTYTHTVVIKRPPDDGQRGHGQRNTHAVVRKAGNLIWHYTI